jgi:hypothetical protein
MIDRRQSAAALVAVDDTHLPILISTFRGQLDLETVTWHDSETNRILRARIRQGRPVVYITDTRRMQVPSATLRQHWATQIKENDDVMRACLGIFVVLDNPLMRGALTAVDWMTNQTRRVHYMPSMQEAVAEANRRLVARGYQPVSLSGEQYTVE